MEIQLTPEIERFFKRCHTNLKNNDKNRFLGQVIHKDQEKSIQRSLQKAGFHEFLGPQETWPSLMISTQAFLNSPYHQTIHLDQLQSSRFRYSREMIRGYELFNLDAIVFDPKRELNDSMVLRALDEDYEATFLWQDNEVWMLDAPSEAATINPIAQKAHGNILTFGLGIGYYVYMASLNPYVKSITVIEQSSAVIDLFIKDLLPQFPNNIPIHILQGDAFDYYNDVYLKPYDHVFVDIYQSSVDGYPILEKLCEQYLAPYEQVDFWIESSCFEVYPSLIFLVYEAMATHKPLRKIAPEYHRIVRKIEAYFKLNNKLIDDVDELKHIMYEPEHHRNIAAMKAD